MITITPAIRRMIGNHGDPLDLIRPIDSNGYAILDDWNDDDLVDLQIFAIIDHSGWKRLGGLSKRFQVRELAPMEVSDVALERRRPFKLRKRGESSAFAFTFDNGVDDLDVLTGRATASLKFERPAHVPGLLIRVTHERVGTFYFTAAFGPGVDIDPVTGERSPHVGPPFIATGNTLTANYALESHGNGPEAYFPCEDVHFAYGDDYFG